MSQPRSCPNPARRALIAALPSTFAATCAGTPFAAWARKRTGAPALVLPIEAPADIDPAGFLVSEKFDGARALWDGHSLRFRSGLPVFAPAWFTARLPAGTAVDGELWLGRGRFEALSAAVRRHEPDDGEWRQIRFMAFEVPQGAGNFAQRAARLAAIAREAAWPQFVAVEQARLDGRDALQERLAEVVEGGGEGLVLHRADAAYISGRSSAVLKLKPLHDAEALVLAHLPGRGRHLGRLGALRVRNADGIAFDIGTGFSDAQREQPPAIGSVISYTHRGSTAAGVPRFASFLRVRSV